MEATATATIDPTPATTTESAPAAPATSAPGSAASSSERPQTARDLSAWMEQHDGADAHPSPAAASTDPAATVPAAASKDGTTNPTTDKGPIPFEVHSKALENARTKAVADYREKFGWAESVPRDTITKFAETAQRMTADPVGFLNTFAAELSAHPVYGPQLRSHAARTLASGRAAPTEPQPDVEIVDGNGQVTGRTYSDKALAARDAFREAQLLAKVRQEYGPLKTERDQRQATERAAAVAKQVEARADDVMSDVMDILDGDKAHLAAVNQAMADNPAWSAHKAAMHVRKTVIAPTLQGKATQAVVDTFNKKAAGNTANGAGSSATPAKPRDAKSLAKWMEANSR